VLVAEMVESGSPAPERFAPHFSEEFGKSGANWSLVSRCELLRENTTYLNEGNGISSTPDESILLAGHIAVSEY
jgi:hypothetical protein